MNLFKDQLVGVTFDDVVAFCGEGNREGWQLDYKRDLPNDGLAKFFAAFSNTRGGLIIIGVEEDRQTGLPSAWRGITGIAHSVERIHQWASNVDPKPNYVVHVTTENRGRAFVLIRINEGSMTPYYVQNDPRVYVRTGNVTPSIDLASPDMLELLVKKKEKADNLRNLRLQELKDIYSASIREGERDRLHNIIQEKQEYERQSRILIAEGKTPPPYKSRIFSTELGKNLSMCKIELQPFYPNTVLMNPHEIKEKLIEIRDGDGVFNIDYPSLNPYSAQNGIRYFEWGKYDGEIRFELINSYGMFALYYDILTRNISRGEKIIYLSHPLYFMFHLFKAATNFYKICGYQGGLIGTLSVDGVEGIPLDQTLGRSMFPSDTIPGLMPRYDIPLELDTSMLNDNQLFQDFFIKKAKEFLWSVGCGSISENSVKGMLISRNWFIEQGGDENG